jgi:hypothetical protein
MSLSRALLMGIEGRGYAVVESLPSLGKGRSCSGLFVTGEEHGESLEAACRERRHVPFQGLVHSRQTSGEASLPVEISRVDPPREGMVTVEFSATDVARDLVG